MMKNQQRLLKGMVTEVLESREKSHSQEAVGEEYGTSLKEEGVPTTIQCRGDSILQLKSIL